jgi:hypothetical protein
LELIAAKARKLGLFLRDIRRTRGENPREGRDRKPYCSGTIGKLPAFPDYSTVTDFARLRG